ncbi:hypothetical protein SDC9_74995 [bioreactor metagenome]|uniref:Uncharacterized protein n=1 Tax=bioreactor metagenome TaxID=1076179 RepID=A0A644YJE8_9ZZZZ
MSKLKEADFYYGAVLSTLINNGICPMLIEGGNDRQVYEFTTDQGDFRLFLKYRSCASETKRDEYLSWQFTFSTSDIQEIIEYLKQEKSLSLGLICGSEDTGESEYAVLQKDDIQQVFDAQKRSLTISRQKGEKAYRVSMGGGRENALQLKFSRLY